MEGLGCKWMSIELNSPYVMASLTLMSHVDLASHADYYKKVSKMGAGAIVMPSVNPGVWGNSENNAAIVDSLIIDTGLHKNHKMGFSILGPTVPNIIPLNYGLSLANALKKEIQGTPVIASIANIGEEEEIITAVNKLSKAGVDGIELNFSCPNVSVKEERKGALTNELLKKIREVTDLPISLKITPFEDYSSILNTLNGEIDGLTLSNAYIGLAPPKLEGVRYSPFDRREEWAPGGVYGPFERLLTFYRLFKYREIAKEKNLSIACVGGIVSEEEAVQAILLGADVVQFSSAIAWHGVSFFEKSNLFLAHYLKEHHFENIDSVKGRALAYIKNNADELTDVSIKRKMKVNQEKCKKCVECVCCDRMCIAISQKTDGTVQINSDLCSGCKWCYYSCVNRAIEESDGQSQGICEEEVKKTLEILEKRFD